ncbi:MAG: hypothetical protein JNK47_11605 [Mesorhizobium sp.]|nr:hypothetical protein [Mesorhizobium sp.]MBL8577865.1 hypothetical protein [Mesorhizobium sp.]
MRLWVLPALALTVLLAGCMSPQERKAADEERCRSYGFKRKNDAFAQCMQRIDMARRARMNTGAYVDPFPGTVIVVD